MCLNVLQFLVKFSKNIMALHNLSVSNTKFQERRRVRVWVEKTFRGRKLPNLTEIYRTSYKPDYKLVPKNEEAKLLASVTKEHNFPDVILPRTIEMPPLMKQFIVKDHEKKGLEVMIFI